MNRTSLCPAAGILIAPKFQDDSATYYDHVHREENFKANIGKGILPGDSIAYAVDSATAGMVFGNYLLIIYRKKPVKPEYTRQFPEAAN